MKVQPYTAELWPCVARLLAKWEYTPYAHSKYGAEAATDLWLERAAHTLANPAASVFMATQGEAVGGIGVLTPLLWDGEQIGMTAARLDCLIAGGDYTRRRDTLGALVASLLMEAKQQNIRHLSARVDAADLAAIHALEHTGLELMDGLLTFGLDLAHASLPERANSASGKTSAFRLRLATTADAEKAGQLARGAYLHDRFHADPAISSERADALHACWVRNSCLGKAADAVILAEDGDELLGFVTCKLHRDTQAHFGSPTGTIVLVAVADAARGRGIGRAATLEALHWMREQGVGLAEVGTQIRNIAASRLYEQCGFRLSSSSLTFRKLC